MDVAKRILQLCKERDNMSINKLADLSYLTQSTLQKIVTGQNADVMLGTIEKICMGLGITLAEFFTEDDQGDDLPFEAKVKLREYEELLRYRYGKTK
ncbi:MAG TPA: helix-turn-helix transcriptional regulator [Methylomusa anaerophila]|uniref:Helix-turn-helix domain protein n=1 Tax=Methylomusa anaerophila TaxID=1930071 RepID=A0A348AIC8_9FIRM|nr:helix-turn-helix transcriptional regulator [Methylomusa anaerophila]BBB90826.1 helix-turn-helix domain protein [Methylomusa anaerophila]HML90517.1 helix-turn-helix transcriptional regulator [Methylomusa anaerophila]